MPFRPHFLPDRHYACHDVDISNSERAKVANDNTNTQIKNDVSFLNQANGTDEQADVKKVEFDFECLQKID